MHEGEPLSRVCTRDGCENNCLICAECERSSHINHEVVPLKGFLEKLDEQKHGVEVETITIDFV